MSDKQNSFEDIIKIWQDSAQKFLQDRDTLKSMQEGFLKLQKEILQTYDKSKKSKTGSTSSSDNIPEHIYDAILQLTARINELETKFNNFEKTYSSKVEGAKRKSRKIK